MGLKKSLQSIYDYRSIFLKSCYYRLSDRLLKLPNPRYENSFALGDSLLDLLCLMKTKI